MRCRDAAQAARSIQSALNQRGKRTYRGLQLKRIERAAGYNLNQQHWANNPPIP